MPLQTLTVNRRTHGSVYAYSSGRPKNNGNLELATILAHFVRSLIYEKGDRAASIYSSCIGLKRNGR